ncbi:hypothetical protein NP493_1365g00010 [Ridgeia piscesae]|uniref:Uncharacterized protein n=1 Tax=Ridgeia piscesae TaxID=27915 RepID=A0AAD9NEK9_RIDPI|nr:hypothetical protein NP493_1365g00010 [Ridgeia piscesae]
MVSGAGWRERQKQLQVNDRRVKHDSNWVQNVVDGDTQTMPVAARRLLSVTRVARRGTSTGCAAITRNRHRPGTARNKP